jgi:hypothetical protein
MDEIDDRVCLFYVSNRLNEIWDLFQEDNVNNKKDIYNALGLKELDRFKRECVYNIGINAINKREEQE